MHTPPFVVKLNDKTIQGTCLFCNNRTSQACKQCSTSDVQFSMCRTASISSTGTLCPKTCFQRCHDSDIIKPDHSRQKKASSRVREANVANIEAAKMANRRRSGQHESIRDLL
jgi:hypothetical protein